MFIVGNYQMARISQVPALQNKASGPVFDRYAKALVGRLLYPVASAAAVSRSQNRRDTFHEAFSSWVLIWVADSWKCLLVSTMHMSFLANANLKMFEGCPT